MLVWFGRPVVSFLTRSEKAHCIRSAATERRCIYNWYQMFGVLVLYTMFEKELTAQALQAMQHCAAQVYIATHGPVDLRGALAIALRLLKGCRSPRL